MASPSENTEIIRMLRDFKNAIYRSGPPAEFDSPGVIRGLRRPQTASRLDFSNVAAKLDFSNLDDTTLNTTQLSSSERDGDTPAQLKRKLIETEMELQTSKAVLKERETTITMMEPSHKKVCLSLEQKLDESRRKNEADQLQIAQLTTKLKHARNEVAFAKSRVQECEKEKRIECNKLETKNLALQQECSSLRLTIAELKSEKAETRGKLNGEMTQLNFKLNMLREECSTSKSLIASLQKQISELTEKATSANTLQEELFNAQSHIKVLENKIAADEDAAVIVRSMQTELKALPEFQKENCRLKEELSKYKETNVSLFQEKMWAFQEKLAQAEKRNIAMAKLQVENETLKNKLEEWESLYDDPISTAVKSPSMFSRKLSSYQKNEMALTSKLASLTAHCESLERKNATLEVTVEQLQNSNDEVKQRCISYDTSVRRLQRKVALLTKERDNCRKLIDSYVGETTLSGSTVNLLHMKNLEDTLLDSQKSLQQAEKEIEILEEKVKLYMKSEKILEEHKLLVKKLEEEKSQLLSNIKKMKISHESLQLKMSESSEGSAAKQETIIHFKHNPYDEAVKKRSKDLKTLQEENDKLQKRVKVLEEGGAGVCDVTAKVEEKLEVEGSESLLKSLKEQLAASEKQNKLIIETARSAATDFRIAVYTLTGYRVDSPGSGKYKLTSVYANSRDDLLLFQVDDDGVHLMETEYSKQLTGLVETYLQTYESVPAFLASHQMELFKQQTCILSQ